MGNLVSGRVVESGGEMHQPMSSAPGGMVVDEGGDQIKGKWVNTRTGEVVIARQLINDGNEGMVITDKGPIPMSQFTNFVQMGDEDMGSVPVTNDTIDSTLISGEDKNILGNLNQERRINLDVPLTQQSSFNQQTNPFNNGSKESPNFKIIDKLFNKFDSNAPTLNIDISWNGFPKEQIYNLIDIFDVPREEIIEYILNKFLSRDKLKDIVVI